MARYWLTSPVSYVKDNRVFVYTEVPAVIELDPATAATLGSAVRAVNENPDVAVEIGDGKAEEAPVERPRRHKASEAKSEAEPAVDGA